MGVVLDAISVWVNGAISTPYTSAIRRAPRSHAERMEQWRVQADRATKGRKKNGVGRPRGPRDAFGGWVVDCHHINRMAFKSRCYKLDREAAESFSAWCREATERSLG